MQSCQNPYHGTAFAAAKIYNIIPTFPLQHHKDSSRFMYCVTPSLLRSPASNMDSISPKKESFWDSFCRKIFMESGECSSASSSQKEKRWTELEDFSRQNEDPSMEPENSSCASSFTFVETKPSTPSELQKSNSRRASLSQLPTHLLFRITAHLDIVSKICLQNTNQRFRDITPVDRAELNTCAKHLLDCRFVQKTTEERMSMQSCFLCKTSKGKKRYSAKHIRHLYEPQHESNKWTTHALEKFPWLRRYSALELNKNDLYQIQRCARPKCYEHMMDQFATNPAVEALMPYIEVRKCNTPGWLAFTILRCMRCGKSILEGDTRLEGCLDCQCDFCPRSPEIQFRKIGPNEANWARPRQFVKSIPDGKYYVVEGSGKGRTSLPIYRPFCWSTRKPLLLVHMGYVKEARSVRPWDMRRWMQVEIGRDWDSQSRLEGEIMRLLDGLGKKT